MTIERIAKEASDRKEEIQEMIAKKRHNLSTQLQTTSYDPELKKEIDSMLEEKKIIDRLCEYYDNLFVDNY